MTDKQKNRKQVSSMWSYLQSFFAGGAGHIWSRWDYLGSFSRDTRRL